MAEVWETTKNTIKGIPPIPTAFITPTKNTFGPIFPKEEDTEDANNESESPPHTTKPYNNSEPEDSDDEDTMLKTLEYQTVKDLVEDTTVLSPKLHPSLMDVINFKREVSNALTLCDLRGDRNGHSYIIETTMEYRLRTKSVIKVLDTQPLQTTVPKMDAPTKDWRAFDRAETKFEMYANYNKQVIAMIKTAFPGALEPLYVEGIYPRK